MIHDNSKIKTDTSIELARFFLYIHDHENVFKGLQNKEKTN